MKPGDRVRLDPATNSRTGRKPHHFTRLGTVQKPKRKDWRKSTVMVVWDDCHTVERLHCDFLELVEAVNDTT